MLIRRHAPAAYLALCLLLGGASAAGVVANMVLQCTALALVCAIVLTDGLPPMPRPMRTLLWLIAAGAGLLLVQLVPLPFALWSALPGRAEIARTLALAGIVHPWLPLSLTSDATIGAALALLPATAMIVAINAAPDAGRRDAIAVLIGIALLSVLLGSLQRAGGESAAFYPYAITNRGSAVGPFANRNHLATLLLCALPFLAAIARATPRARIPALAAALVLAGGAMLTGSIAAIGLLVPTLAGCVVLFTRKRATRRHRRLGIAPITRVAVGLLVIGLVGIGLAGNGLLHTGPVMGTSARSQPRDDTMSHHRGAITATTLRAARDHFPFGTGAGSFRTIYPSYEDATTITPEYVNHAHDDYAEILLEDGVPGALLVIAALALSIVATGAAWRDPSGGVSGIDRDRDRARAASIAVGILLVHSGVDYPLRTAALAAVAGLAAALLLAPIPAPDPAFAPDPKVKPEPDPEPKPTPAPIGVPS